MPNLDRRSFLIATGVAVAGPPEVEAQTSAIFRPAGLRTEYIEQPLGLETPRPRLSWRMQGAERNLRQSAYRITAASSPDALDGAGPLLWDSGRVVSGRSFEIPYGGPELSSGQRVWWRVEVSDQHGRPSAPSEPSWFEMGLLSPADWRADWLAVQDPKEKADRAAGVHWIWGENVLDPRPQRFRLAFDLPEAPAEAVLMVSGKDHLTGVFVNGSALELPEKLFWGTFTSWRSQLKRGRNVLAIEAKADTDGFFKPDGGAVAAFLRLRMPDGRVLRLTSGPEWRTSNDAAPGWSDPGFDDRGWARAEPSRAKVRNEPWPPRPPMLARREFTADKPVTRARVYATALGAHDIRLNGDRISDARLAPEITVFSDHVLYQTYDVTRMIKPGANVIGAVLGDGWYASAFGWRNERYGFGPGPRRFRAQLVLDYADGSRAVVGTSPDWRMSLSPILSSEIYNGEVFDGRLRQLGWGSAGFDDRRWIPMEAAPPAEGRLVSQVDPPIRGVQTLRPQSVSEPVPRVFVFDFGQNFAGWCQLRAKGAAGATVTLRFAEILKPSGEVDQSNLRGARATDVFTLRGDAEGEQFEPHFTYHGFRYVQVSGYPGRPTLADLTGVVAHTDCRPTGRLQTQNTLVQQIWHNALWSQRSNFFGVPTDCPQRDERMGWMGDIQVFLDAAAFNMDVDAFIRRFMLEVRAGQTPDGGFPIVTPQPLSFPDEVTAGWSEAGVILPWTLYRRYGDTRVIDDNWQAMARWVAYVADVNPDHIWRDRRGLDLGDWLSVDAVNPADETTPRVLVATAYWAYVAALMAEMARATGRTADADRYARMRGDIGRAFAAAFVRPDGTVGNGSQTSYVLALKFDLIPAALRTAAGEHLAADIRRRGMRLSTGFLGTPYLLDVLTDTGHADVAVSLLLQTEYPSWGYMIRKGATTMWERWNGDVGDVSMNSYNHYAFGAVVGYMYRRLAGIAPRAPGFTEIEVRPVFDPRIGRVQAEYDSCVGRIATEVDGDGGGVSRLSVSVPANASARVHLPARTWRESRRPLAGRNDVEVLAQDGRETVLRVGSGDYLFTAEA